jgi:ADP-ribose pyrophosphatase
MDMDPTMIRRLTELSFAIIKQVKLTRVLSAFAAGPVLRACLQMRDNPTWPENYTNGRAYPSCPRVGVGALVIEENRVLLIKRGIEPSRGLWAIPGGMLELGETLQEGAEREILEETGLIIQAGEPVHTFDFFEHDGRGKLRYHFVIVDLWGRHLGGELKSGDDAAEVRWLTAPELSSLPVSRNTLALLRKVRFLS